MSWFGLVLSFAITICANLRVILFKLFDEAIVRANLS